MPKTSDGIDNILIYYENEKLSYRAGTDMVGKVRLLFIDTLDFFHTIKYQLYS